MNNPQQPSAYQSSTLHNLSHPPPQSTTEDNPPQPSTTNKPVPLPGWWARVVQIPAHRSWANVHHGINYPPSYEPSSVPPCCYALQGAWLEAGGIRLPWDGDLHVVLWQWPLLCIARSRPLPPDRTPEVGAGFWGDGRGGGGLGHNDHTLCGLKTLSAASRRPLLIADTVGML